MNSTSPSFRFVSIDARSPGFSIAGPDVMLMPTPISFAIIRASVVLPSPGGPYSSTWSRLSPLSFAALIKTDIFSLTLSCPIYSFRRFGRRLNSISVSSGENSGSVSRVFSEKSSCPRSWFISINFQSSRQEPNSPVTNPMI